MPSRCIVRDIFFEFRILAVNWRVYSCAWVCIWLSVWSVVSGGGDLGSRVKDDARETDADRFLPPVALNPDTHISRGQDFGCRV